ncbi:MAG TPA: NAD(P)-binding domain-containing protein [Stellaceae bacterium]
MSGLTDIAIVGAGPYGLSIAAHLHRQGIDYRIFGAPMNNWRTRMPQGMLLKSDGFASNLMAPGGDMMLADYCAGSGIPYADEGIPVASGNFIAYGDAFQARYVPDLDGRQVVSVTRAGERFSVELDDGEITGAAKVIVAIGISDFGVLPPHLAHLPREYVSHASDHAAMDQFTGREVAVIGGGSSATDLSALMHEGGASVQLITRRKELSFHNFSDPATRTLSDRLRWPGTGIGQGWRSVAYTRAPLLFRFLPDATRLHIIATSQAIAGSWPMRDRVFGKVTVKTGLTPQSAEIRGHRIHLDCVAADGTATTISADHAILCTGYRVNLQKIAFLDPGLRGAIETAANTPLLSRNFESSVPGLYFVGPASAPSFGPMFRFVYGCEFTAPRIAAHLERSLARRSVSMRPALAAR